MKNDIPYISDPMLFGEWYDISWFHACYVHGLAFTIRERLGYGLSRIVGEQEGAVQRIYFSRKEWTQIGETYLAEVIEDPTKLEILLKDVREASDALTAFSHDLENKNCTDASSDDVLLALEDFHRLHHEVWALGMVPNVLDLENDVMRTYLKKWLLDHGTKEDDMLSVFQDLVTPSELSMAQKEERAMLELAQHEQGDNVLKKHWETYRWLQYGWTGPALSLEYFEDVHTRLLEEGNAKEYLDEQVQKDTALLFRKDQILRQLAIDEKKQLFQLYEELLFMKSYRMDAIFYSYVAIEPCLKRIAKDYFLSMKQIYTCYLPWLIDMIRSNTFHPDYLNTLGRYSAQYLEDGQLKLLVGDEAEAFMKPIHALMPAPPEANEIKGECAFPGFVHGKVCIVNRTSEMEKFEEGNILVSNVTDPSLLPIMKKASAFVTNMGGLTCHAAIVSRELGIPCIIGTKIATKVLKDGDMVEVDAGKGIVKKIL